MEIRGQMIPRNQPASFVGLLLSLALLLSPMALCEIAYLDGCPNNITTSSDPGEEYATVVWHPPVTRNATNTSTLTKVTNSNPGDRFDIGVTQVTYVLDDEAVTINCTFFIHVKDNEDPVFLTCPSNITINVTSVKAETVVTWQLPKISDNSRYHNSTSDHNSGEFFPIGDTTVHYTATDPAGNTASCEFVVSVTDLRVLEFTDCPRDITQILQSGQSRDAVTWQEPIILLEGRDISVTANRRPGTLFDLGHTEVSYTAVDTLGNVAHCNFIVIVTGFPYNHFVPIADSFLPGRDDSILLHSSVEDCLIACLSEKTFVCQSVDFSVREKCMLSRATAADLWGILAKHKGFTHYERLMEGTRPILVDCPQNITQPTEAGQTYATVSWQEPAMSDGEPAVIEGTRSPKSRFHVGVTKVVYTTTDSGGNSLSCDFFVTVHDEEPPIINECPQNITKVTTNQEAVKAFWVEPRATDNLGPPRLSSNHQLGDWFPTGSTTVTYSAQDNAGNQAECSFVIQVKDIPDSNYISLQLELQNATFSDALLDSNSLEFQKLASSIEKDILNIFHGDRTVLGVEIDQFSSDTDDDVAADVKIGFSEPLNHEGQQVKLHMILAATLNKLLAYVGKVQFKQDHGMFQVLDACTLSPCPTLMNCRAIGLRCTATCTDNPEYCLNGGKCTTNAQNFIACNCHSENQVYTYSGDRCNLTRMALTGKQLTVMSLGGVWVIVMLGMLAVYCMVIGSRKHGSPGQACRPLHVFADDSTTEWPRHIRMVTSEDLGYTSHGEEELSPAESDSHLDVNREEQAKGRPWDRQGANDNTDGPHEGSTGPHDGSTGPGPHDGIPDTHNGIFSTCDESTVPNDGIPCTNDRIPGTHDVCPGTHDRSTGPHDGSTGPHDGSSRSHNGSVGPHNGILSPKASPQKGSLHSHNSRSTAEQSQSSASRSSSSCTFCKSSSCSSASHSSTSQSGSCSSCTCDSGTEVIQISSLGVSNTVSDGAAITAVKPPQMTVQVDIERIPHEQSSLTQSYNGVIPDPIIESEDESTPFINPPPQTPPLGRPEATPLLSHYRYLDGEIPDPVIQYKQSTGDSASLSESRPQTTETFSEQRSLSSSGAHSYEGIIPDPVLDFDEQSDRQSGDVHNMMPTGGGVSESYGDGHSTAQFELFTIPRVHSVDDNDDIEVTESHFV